MNKTTLFYKSRIVFVVVLFATTFIDSVFAFQAHPLAFLNKDAEVLESQSFEYTELSLPIGTENQAKTVKTMTVAGRAYYSKLKLNTTSASDIIKSVHSVGKSKGFQTLFECLPEQCEPEIIDYIEHSNGFGGFSFGARSNSPVFSARYTHQNKSSVVFYTISDWGSYSEVYQIIVDEVASQQKKTFDQVNVDAKAYQSYLNKNTSQYGATEKDIENSQDHPLIGRHQHSSITTYSQLDYTEIHLPMAALNKNPSSNATLPIAGKGTFIEYKTAKGVSQIDVVKNYRAAFQRGEFDILFQCTKNECGSEMESFLESDRAFKGFTANMLGDMPLIVARHTFKGKNTFVLMTVSNLSDYLFVYLAVIEEKQLATNKVHVDADYISKTISESGKVAIYGIEFDFNSDKIRPESTSTLKEISLYLKKNKSVSLYIVGHTDAKGDETYNLALSQKRADSVVEALINRFAITRSRLKSRGVGELVPLASNQNEEGRQVNRRVELVLDI